MQVLECQYKALEVIILNPLATRLCLTSGKKTQKREREREKNKSKSKSQRYSKN